MQTDHPTPPTETIAPMETITFTDIVEKQVRATNVMDMIIALRFHNLKMLQTPNIVEKVIHRAKWN